MNIHFIAVGGAVMHNLAIVLKRKGHTVTGSDDVINEPSRSNLEREGLLPARIGFFEDNIQPGLDAVILGMHAREDNPELIKAQHLGIKIFSFPEYVYEVSKNKQRVVIAGSHGKTTITSMVMHVLRSKGIDFDYLVGAKVKGFDTSVRLTESAPIIVIEGDEYLASPIHLDSKFLFYKPNVALISGVAWDHINVFPDYDDYVAQFARFADSVEEWGFLTWYAEDEELKQIFNTYQKKVRTRPYMTHEYNVRNGQTYLQTSMGEIPLMVFGQHNLQNIAGAKNVCNELGVKDDEFYKAISTFEGAANRLQLLAKSANTLVYKDFAHSPSKLKATVHAMKNQYPERDLVAVMELHTFSSLNADFMSEYRGCMDEADISVIYLDRHTFEQKRMTMLDPEFVKENFDNHQLHIFTDASTLKHFLESQSWANKNLLLMSSGTFGGANLQQMADEIVNATS